MFKTPEEALKYVKEEKVASVDLKFTDMTGRWRHLSMPASAFRPVTFEDGVGVDGSSISKFRGVECGDMCIVPDVATAILDPFYNRKTLSFICDVVEADTRERFEFDPRRIAQRAEAHLRSTGIAEKSMWSPEFEFHVFDSVMFDFQVNRGFYQVDCGEAAWNTGMEEHNLGHKIPYKGGYHAIPPMDSMSNLRDEMVATIEEVAGIPVRYHHHEVGGPGQMEIEIFFHTLTEAADACMAVKYIIKNIAIKHGRTATFIPKPLYTEAGNGMHIHQFLMGKDGPVFYDEKGYGGLSRMALQYVAGILQHGRALLAFTNPSTNSYKRLIPGYEAPVHLFFSLANRSAAVRVPKYATRPEEKRFEFRPSDATCNIYLALSALLMAGIDGIKKELDPTALGFGPYDVNIFDPRVRDQVTVKGLPSSLAEALDALKEDHDFLLEGDVFTEEFIDRWIDYKMTEEFNEVRNRPHPYEFHLYYDA